MPCGRNSSTSIGSLPIRNNAVAVGQPGISANGIAVPSRATPA
jgi:hypothetical protein